MYVTQFRLNVSSGLFKLLLFLSGNVGSFRDFCNDSKEMVRRC